ncbi:glycoside hydrolase/deacetylase [Ophiobolus disseminans]|uniref:Glycoside hydrolase/deacetylase n=1 Tax=Ophiobolus disseminans TaxID=1469910 RepID=A0A6A7AJJ5_9PLEO|nr:glycoside hydrolase/deacetylase [Ophiobolus disseminans]
MGPLAIAAPGSPPPSQLQHHTLSPRQKPTTPSPRIEPRPQKGNIPYGGPGIYSCTVPGTVALTFDDGPYIYTAGVMDQFATYGFKATFFVTGDNGRGPLDANPSGAALVRRMLAEGHQVGSHTWTHTDLNTLSDQQQRDEMLKTEAALKNIIGKTPTYMRPPYGSCNEACGAVMKDLGYVVAHWDLETDDWRYQADISISENIFKSSLAETDPKTGGRVVLAHDIHEQTATRLTAFMLGELKARGFRGVTLGECLGEPEENWYR